jgi:hypothetical protein
VMQKFGVFEPARKPLDADDRECRNLYPADPLFFVAKIV